MKALLAAANTYDEMKAAFAEICPILQSHTYVEERFFYPRFENHEQLYQLIKKLASSMISLNSCSLV